MDDSQGMGWGYGLGACNSWTGSEAQGFNLQYAFVNESGASPNHSRQHLPEKNATDMPVGDVDSSSDTYVWTIRYQDEDTVTLTQNEGISLGPYPLTRGEGTSRSPLPRDCRGKGVFLRVFNADVTFSDFSIEQLAA
ncbi:hypothetical protein [Streptomyces sp. MJP52]|uniref:hypothetical protein n=1 Tax=Streptomyces sp. MJP52 TaxID=2940555 RepID=UPI002475111E|nr:hypothetical protein [Streptomyces sp. MJP52]